MMRQLLAFLLLAALSAAMAAADERIRSFDVEIAVETDGDIVVREQILVNVEGNQIRRGIFRDLPRHFRGPNGKQRYDYDILEVTRDGRREPYETETDGNAFRIRIGDADKLLERREHSYEIRYSVKNQIRYFETYDELYWNVTGTYWAFPIDSARAEVVLPSNGRIIQQAAYTGGRGSTETDGYRYTQNGTRHIFETTSPLDRREGLTIALGFEKGLVDPPSASDARALWWQRHGAATLLFVTSMALLAWLWRAYDTMGRDPPPQPVFPRYEPPVGYSPAAAHHIYYRGLRDHTALIATLVHLAIQGRLEIDVSDKKKTRIVADGNGASGSDLKPEEAILFDRLFAGRQAVDLDGTTDTQFTKAYIKFRKRVVRDFGRDYFRWNEGWTIATVGISVIAIIIALRDLLVWTPYLTGVLVLLVAINLAFMYFIPAPTRLGRKVRSEIAGFRLYLKTAEALRLNAADVGTDQPPPMSRDLYEAFLPYAIALNVEKPWTTHFENAVPKEAATYNPTWSLGSRGFGSVSAMNKGLVAGLSTGVASAMPSSSGSSGSGGGGSSGGGGGGGGGGGW